jgi:hypothetical protein
LKSWLSISKILLGLVSVSLSCALFNFLILTSLMTPVYPAFMALSMQTPWFILATIACVVGFVDYFAGRENTTREQNTVKPIRRQFSNYINPLWSLHIGAFSTPVLLALQLGLGFKDNMTIIFGTPSPMFASIIAGAVVGLLTLILIYVWNHH